MQYFLALGVVIAAAEMVYGFKRPRQASLRGNNWMEENAERELRIIKSYTQDADFASGSMVNVNHDETHDQLQLDSTSRPFNFIWVAASARGTIVKIDTNSGEILGEFRSTPASHSFGNPSRTTVDRDGSVWLTNRNDIYDGYGSVVHIGLLENNQCEDRNGNGKIDTSLGLGDIKDWVDTSGLRGVATAEDECIVHYTKLNSQGTRHVSVTSANDVWVSGVGAPNFDLIKGGKFDVIGSGNIIRNETSVGYGGYGGLIDPNGVIWSASRLLRWDTAKSLSGDNGDPPDESIGPPAPGTNWSGQDYDSYGLCIDSKGNVWNTQLDGNIIRKYAPDGTFLGAYEHGDYKAQGCVVGLNDDMYIAHSLYGSTIGHLKNDGTFVGNIVLEGTDGFGPGDGPTGVAMDRNGKIWTTNFYSNMVSRIDPSLGDLGADGATRIGKVDKTVSLGDDASPYNYSDMTGSTLIQPPTSGIWVATYTGSDWHTLVWNSDVPNGSSLSVRARSRFDNISSWTTWEIAGNGKGLGLAPGGFLQIQVNFQRSSGTSTSPVLYELSVKLNDPPIVEDDSVSTLQNTPVSIEVTKNDADPDGDILTVSSCTQPTNGAVGLSGASVTYTPKRGFTGTDRFNCTVCDPQPSCDDEMITVTVTRQACSGGFWAMQRLFFISLRHFDI